MAISIEQALRMHDIERKRNRDRLNKMASKVLQQGVSSTPFKSTSAERELQRELETLYKELP